MTEPTTETGRSVLEHIIEDAAGYVTLTSGRFTIGWVVDALRNDIPRIEAEARIDAAAEILKAVETEWYNGNMGEGARDRIFAVVGAEP